MDKSRRRRRSQSGSKSFHMEDQDAESPALNSLQEMISSLKQIPPSKGSLDHQLSPHPTTSPTPLDFLRTADLDNGDTIISKHVSQSPTTHEPMFPNSKSWNSVDEDYRHPGMMGTSQGSAHYFQQRMNSYGSHGRKWSYSSYSSSVSREAPNVVRQLHDRQLFRGILFVDERDCSDSYVICEELDAHIYIYGSRNRNRALHGDVVAVRLVDVDLTLSEKNFKNSRDNRSRLQRKLSTSGLSWTEIKEDNFENSAGKPPPKYSGVVVAILERVNNASLAGTLVRQRPTAIKESIDSTPSDSYLHSENKESSAVVWLKPRDKKLPLVAIPIDQAPEGFLQYHEEYQKRLFVATFRRWPTTSLHPFGTLDGEIGLIGELTSEEKAILADNHIISEGFSEQCLKSLPAIPWPIPPAETKVRRDVNGPETRVFTLNRDFKHAVMDVAVSVTKIGKDIFEIGVHAADVGYFVRPKTAVDKEARDRGLLVRLVDRTIPMLPETLHKNLCSFRAGRKRLGFSVIWTMSSDGHIHETWFGKTVLKSCAQFSFAQVQSVVQGSSLSESIKLHDCTASEMEEALRSMSTLASSLRQRRLGLNKSATGQKTRLSFELNANGFPEALSTTSHCEAQDALQELCIMANVSVAQKITKHFPEHALLRRQDPIIDTLLKSFAPDDPNLDMHSFSKDAFEAALLGIHDVEELGLLRFLAAKSARPALYFGAGTTDINKYFHHGHGVSLYTHFTSPVCRYAAIVVHRQLEAALRQEREWHSDKEEDEKIIMHCNVRENASRNAAEQSSHLYLCSYLNRQNLIASNLHQNATVFCIQEDSIDIYIHAYDLRQRIFLDDINAEHAYDSITCTITLTWSMEDHRFGAGDDELVLEDVEADLPKGHLHSSTADEYAHEVKATCDNPPLHNGVSDDSDTNASPTHVQTISRLEDIEVAMSVDMNVSPPVIIVDVVNSFFKQA
ncbi:unnamed protein product [Umbelopsis ramanniana]